MTQVPLNKQFEAKGLAAYQVNFTYAPSDLIEIAKNSTQGDTYMKSSSSKHTVNKTYMSWLSGNRKVSDVSGGSISTGNSSGMMDSDEKMRERAMSQDSPQKFTEIMLDRWQKSNQCIPTLD